MLGIGCRFYEIYLHFAVNNVTEIFQCYQCTSEYCITLYSYSILHKDRSPKTHSGYANASELTNVVKILVKIGR